MFGFFLVECWGFSTIERCRCPSRRVVSFRQSRTFPFSPCPAADLAASRIGTSLG